MIVLLVILGYFVYIVLVYPLIIYLRVKSFIYAGEDLKPAPLRGAMFQIVTDTAPLKNENVPF